MESILASRDFQFPTLDFKQKINYKFIKKKKLNYIINIKGLMYELEKSQ